MSARHIAAILCITQLLAFQLTVANAAEHVSSDAPTPPAAETEDDIKARKALKAQLVDALSSGETNAASYDKESEIKISVIEMQLVRAYLKQGDRKYALVYALLARRTLQHLYPNPYDPRLIPVYSLLVQVYESSYDRDEPNVNKFDAEHAKLYRQMIDHIHSN